MVSMMLRCWLRGFALALVALCGTLATTPAWSASSFTLFESGQVRPLALSPDGTHLFAVNTPDNRLEIFRVRKHGLRHVGSVPVGLEPVAVAARSNDEVWVVNHLSDSVSVVKVSRPHLRRVIRTLLVGDEPRDIVFAGPDGQRAFVTTAHRGQNTGRDPELTKPGVGRADVWVFDANRLGPSPGGDPLTVVNLFTDTPRALAVTPNGATVYAAGFHTGNRTTTINEFLVRQGTAPPFNRVYPGPRTNYASILQPQLGLIVKFDGQHWVDELGQHWDDMVPFKLPDKDVFEIDAMANPPAPVEDGAFSDVGTVIFNMIVNPANGRVYVSNTEALNQNRFEGPGEFAGHTVRGHFSENRITVLTGPNGVEPRHLNKHIDYSKCCAPIPNAENAASVAFPMDMAITRDGTNLFVTAFGTSEIAVYDTAEIENDTFVPSSADQINVSGGGPSGVVLDERRGRLYVLTRFDNSISTIDLASRTEVGHLQMYNPEPRRIVKGRRFLYDASFTSSHGDSACASCHVFGDLDSLAWDLGNPDADEIKNPGPFLIEPGVGFFLLRKQAENPHFRPMKGPMTTQSLRGLDNHGPMHWRGDRTANSDEPNLQPNGGAFNEQEAFRKFNVAFPGLLGRHEPLSDPDMQAFTDFILEVTYPPNPIRNLDNSLTREQQKGADFFANGVSSDTFFDCQGCHVLDRDGNRGYAEVKKPGFFGTDGRYTFRGESQFFKVPHLRNLYQKVGMFGMAPPPPPPQPPFPFDPSQIAPVGSLTFAPIANNGLMGDQLRGFGFLHDGSVDTVFRFLSAAAFAPRPPGTIPSLDPRTPPSMVPDPGNVGGLRLTPEDNGLRREIESFMLAFDSNMAPIVGQQVTLTSTNADVVGPRIDLLIYRADAQECDLIAKHRNGGFLYTGRGRFRSSFAKHLKLADAALRALAREPGGEVTYTCAPPGSGKRMGIDRDEDGLLDTLDRRTAMRRR